MKIAIRPSILPENSLTLRRQNSVLRVSVNSQTEWAQKFSEKKMRKWIEISPAKLWKGELQFSLKKLG